MDAKAERKAILITVIIAGLTALVIWLLVFDLWLGQVERQYLWENAQHELHLGPAVSLEAMMDQGRSTGAWVASGWSLLVAAAIAGAARYAYVRGRIAGATWTR